MWQVAQGLAVDQKQLPLTPCLHGKAFRGAGTSGVLLAEQAWEPLGCKLTSGAPPRGTRQARLKELSGGQDAAACPPQTDSVTMRRPLAAAAPPTARRDWSSMRVHVPASVHAAALFRQWQRAWKDSRKKTAVRRMATRSPPGTSTPMATSASMHLPQQDAPDQATMRHGCHGLRHTRQRAALHGAVGTAQETGSLGTLTPSGTIPAELRAGRAPRHESGASALFILAIDMVVEGCCSFALRQERACMQGRRGAGWLPATACCCWQAGAGAGGSAARLSGSFWYTP